jgi:transposase
MRRREILGSYRREKQSRNRNINQLHALFVHQGIATVVRKDLATEESRKETVKTLSGLVLEEAEHLLSVLKLQDGRIRVLETKMKDETEGDGDIERLKKIPGVGTKVAFAFVSYVDVKRFEKAGQVSNYLGLMPRVDISGTLIHYGGIKKRGNGYLRSLLDERVTGPGLVRGKNW